MPAYDSFAEFYDLCHAGFETDIPFWLEEAKQAAGPVCELCCGTGRVLLPLARAGIAITGLDISQPMLDRLQAELDKEPAEVQGRVGLIRADMRTHRFSTRFRLVFCAFNSFLHLMTTDDQLACLESVREYLAPGGRLIIDVFAPFHNRLAVTHEVEDYTRSNGVLVHQVTTRDIAHHAMESTLFCDTTGADGLVNRRQVTLTLTWIHYREMQLLFRLAGYRVINVYGRWDRRPYDYVSGSQIFVAEKA